LVRAEAGDGLGKIVELRRALVDDPIGDGPVPRQRVESRKYREDGEQGRRDWEDPPSLSV
jgi:hypothetical protein